MAMMFPIVNSFNNDSTPKGLSLREQVAMNYCILAETNDRDTGAIIGFMKEIDAIVDKVVEIWPMMGNNKQYGLIDPGGDFTLAFPDGVPADDDNGYNWNGEWADTGINWFWIIGEPLNNFQHEKAIGAFLYTRDTIQDNWFGSGGFKLYISDASTPSAYVNIDGQSDPIPYTTNKPGLKFWQRKRGNTVEHWRGLTKEGEADVTVGALSATNIALNRKNESTPFLTPNTSSIAGVTLELTDDEYRVLATAIINLMINTGRLVDENA